MRKTRHIRIKESGVCGTGGEGKEAEEKPGPSRSRVEPVKPPRQSNGAQAPDGKKLPKWMKLSKK